jgi:hypothetical protein
MNFTRPLAVHCVSHLAKGGKYWIYEYLFAKKDRENIENDELLAFRLLAKSFEKISKTVAANACPVWTIG